MNTYIFVAAAILAVIPIIVVFKVNVEKLKKNPRQLHQVQRQFFTGVVLCKIVPIIFLVFGIYKMTPKTFDDIFIPLLIILLTTAYGVYFIFSQQKVAAKGEVNITIHTLAMMAIPLSVAIPLMAAFFLYMMIL